MHTSRQTPRPAPRVTANSHFRFRGLLQEAGSGTGKSIRKRDKCTINRRDHAHRRKGGLLTREAFESDLRREAEVVYDQKPNFTE